MNQLIATMGTLVTPNSSQVMLTKEKLNLGTATVCLSPETLLANSLLFLQLKIYCLEELSIAVTFRRKKWKSPKIKKCNKKKTYKHFEFHLQRASPENAYFISYHSQMIITFFFTFLQSNSIQAKICSYKKNWQ